MLNLSVNINTIKNNLCAIRKSIVDKKLYAVVKANAYGVGMDIVKYIENDVDGFCVANAYELMQLRKAGCKGEVLILGAVENAYYDENTVVSISSLDELERLQNKTSRIALKINTGMNRLGCGVEEFEKIYLSAVSKGYFVESVFSHLFCATDIDSSQKQLDRFEKATCFLSGKVNRHICASNCIILPSKYYYDGARVGLALYGYGYDNVQPALCLYGVIEQINYVKVGENIGYGSFVAPNNMNVATVSVGYGDGFSAGATMPCIVNGKKCYSVGQICMDFMSVDVSGIKCKVGDRVYFLCEQLKMQETACSQNKIFHETICSLAARVRRIYCDK